MNSLPVEIISKIFEYLQENVKTLLAMRLVSNSMNFISTDLVVDHLLSKILQLKSQLDQKGQTEKHQIALYVTEMVKKRIKDKKEASIAVENEKNLHLETKVLLLKVCWLVDELWTLSALYQSLFQPPEANIVYVPLAVIPQRRPSPPPYPQPEGPTPFPEPVPRPIPIIPPYPEIHPEPDPDELFPPGNATNLASQFPPTGPHSNPIAPHLPPPAPTFAFTFPRMSTHSFF